MAGKWKDAGWGAEAIVLCRLYSLLLQSEKKHEEESSLPNDIVFEVIENLLNQCWFALHLTYWKGITFFFFKLHFVEIPL
jgi:hypothetical protein